MLLEVMATWAAVVVAVLAVATVASKSMTVCLAAVAVLMAVLLTADQWRRRWWHQRGIPIADSARPLIGHMLEDINYGCYRFYKVHKTYLATKGVDLVCRLSPLGAPKSFQVHSLDLSNRVLIKDFDHFVDRREFVSDKVSDEFLTNLSGARWKSVRALMSPAFTSGKLKNIFEFMEVKSHTLVRYMNENMIAGSSMDMENTVQKFNIDTVGSTVFGIDMNILQGDNTGLAEAIENLLRIGFLKDTLKIKLIKRFPWLCHKFGVKSWYMYVVDAVRTLVMQRLKTEDKHDDFLELMIDAKKKSADTGILTENTVVSSIVIFLLAGFDTTTGTVTMILHTLAMYPEYQAILRQELKKLHRDDGHLTYHDVMDSTYLDAFCNETMRFYPAGHAIERKCTKDYQFPGTDVVIKEGEFAVIPVYSFHHDGDFFPEPEVFNPDRFLPENKADIRSGTFLPFGLGPRMCIAQRFALMSTKLTIAQLVLNFEVSYPDDHPGLVFSDKIGIMRPTFGNSKFIMKTISS